MVILKLMILIIVDYCIIVVDRVGFGMNVFLFVFIVSILIFILYEEVFCKIFI